MEKLTEYLETTNYYDSEHARHGLLFFSINGGVIRCLLPDNQINILSEIKTGKEVIITKGAIKNKIGDMIPGFEILFDDHTDEPFSVTGSLNDQFDQIPADDDRWQCHIYTRDGLAWKIRRCLVRSDVIPCLKPWEA